MPANGLTFAIVLAGTGAGATIDLRTRRVPNVLVASLAGAGIAMAAAGLGRIGIAGALAGCVLGALLMLPGYLFGATGGGDVKLLAAAGTLLGPTSTLWAFLFTAIAGGALALGVAAYRGRVGITVERSLALVRTVGRNAAEIEHAEADNRFAYGPAIAIGVVAAAVLV